MAGYIHIVLYSHKIFFQNLLYWGKLYHIIYKVILTNRGKYEIRF